MRGEEVSREIPFIFSRAFADTRPRSAWGERSGFCLQLEKRSSREAPAGTDAGSKREEAGSPRGWVVWGWAGQVTAASLRWAMGLGLVPLCSSAVTGTWHTRGRGGKGAPPHPTVPMAHRYQLSVLVGQPGW